MMSYIFCGQSLILGVTICARGARSNHTIIVEVPLYMYIHGVRRDERQNKKKGIKRRE